MRCTLYVQADVQSLVGSHGMEIWMMSAGMDCIYQGLSLQFYLSGIRTLVYLFMYKSTLVRSTLYC